MMEEPLPPPLTPEHLDLDEIDVEQPADTNLSTSKAPAVHRGRAQKCYPRCRRFLALITSDKAQLGYRVTAGMFLCSAVLFFMPPLSPQMARYWGGACLSPLMLLVVWSLGAKNLPYIGAVLRAALMCAITAVVGSFVAVAIVTACLLVSRLLFAIGVPAPGVAQVLSCVLLVLAVALLNLMRWHPLLSAGNLMGLIVLGEIVMRPWSVPGAAVALLFDGAPGFRTLLCEASIEKYCVPDAHVPVWVACVLWAVVMLALVSSALVYSLMGIVSASAAALLILPRTASAAASRLLGDELAHCGHLISGFSSNILGSGAPSVRHPGSIRRDPPHLRPRFTDPAPPHHAVGRNEVDLATPPPPPPLSPTAPASDGNRGRWRMKHMRPGELSATGEAEKPSTPLLTATSGTLARTMSLLESAPPAILSEAGEAAYARLENMSLLSSFVPFEEALLPSASVHHCESVCEMNTAIDVLTRRLSRLCSVVAGDKRKYGRVVLDKWWGNTRHDWMELFARMAAATHTMRKALDPPACHSFLSCAGGLSGEEQLQSVLRASDELLDIHHIYLSLRRGILERFRSNWKVTAPRDITPFDELRSLMFVTTYTKRVVHALIAVNDRLRALVRRRVERGQRERAAALRATVGRACTGVVTVYAEAAQSVVRQVAAGEWSWTETLASAETRYSIKHFIAIALSVLPVVVLAPLSRVSPSFESFTSEWQLFWLYVTVVIVFNRTLDATISKLFMRLVATFLSVLVGYVIMLYCPIALSGALLLSWLLVCTFVCTVVGDGPFKYAYVLFLITQVIMIACQFHPTMCISTWSYAVARCVSVVVGGLIASAVSALVFPSLAIVDISRTASQAVRESAEVMSALVSLFVEVEYNPPPSLAASPPAETRGGGDGGGGGEEADVCPIDPINDTDPSRLDAFHFLQRTDTAVIPDVREHSVDIERRLSHMRVLLSQMEATLRLESVPWRKGPLRLPAWCPVFAGQLRELTSSLTLTLTLINREPVVTGEYTGSVGHSILRGGGELAMRRTAEAYSEVAGVLAACLYRIGRVSHGNEPTSAEKDILRAAVTGFTTTRTEALASIAECREKMATGWVAYLAPVEEELADLEELEERKVLSDPPGLQVDDAFRFYSYLYSLALSLDLMASMVDTVLGER